MSQPLTVDALVSIHTIMQKMLQEAISEDWHSLNELDTKRRDIIQQQGTSNDTSNAIGRATTNAKNKAIYNSWCEKILQLDTQITETVQNAKQKLVEENRNMRNQVIAKKGYAQTANAKTAYYNHK